ncbi:hypothetical protein AB3Y40_05430 [Yoonia sp. R2331]|uniref:hypothetical protein n=1 Tax=Yoonia sp. R2331 TaxID=3237238 RepID=UPI0034E3AD3E
MRRGAIALLALTACDVAPRPVELERGFVETPAVGYQLFVDTIIASSTARRAAEGCPAYSFDEAARDGQMRFFEDEMERLAVDDPATLEGIHQRLGIDVTAEQVVANGYDGLSAPDVDTGFLIRNAGVTVDIGTRAIGMVGRRGLVDDCKDAEREIAQGTMAGSFLKPIEGELNGTFAKLPHDGDASDELLATPRVSVE